MNLLLISIDSLRLDHVSRTNPRIHTPRFDQLVRDFRFCERLFSVSSATRPVHTTLFTGFYPFEHGVLGQSFPRMRPGLPHLFELFQRQNRAIGGFSEAPTVFAGLDFAPWIEVLSAARINAFLQRHRKIPQFLFLHYWSAHTPYGAPDGKAFGETARLLESGQHHIVQERYARAVENVFEGNIAPLLAQLDLQQWCVIILSDHGESWTAEEPYHGVTLRNAVLRVPLYIHIPHTGMAPLPRPLLSIVDLFPTLVNLFELPADYQGFGRDIRQEDGPAWYLAQIHPIPGQDDLKGEPAPAPLLQGFDAGPQWAIFDARHKFTYDEKRGEGKVEYTLTEEAVPDQENTPYYLAEYARMQAESACGLRPPASASREEENLLEQRLRDLGYLE